MRHVLEFDDAFLKHKIMSEYESSIYFSHMNPNQSLIEQIFDSIEPNKIQYITDDE